MDRASNQLFEQGSQFLDSVDPLSSYSQLFHIPDSSKGQKLSYFCGHSLGLQARSSSKYIEQVLMSWRRSAVKGHFEGKAPWMHYHKDISEVMSGMVGARPSEVTLMNTLSINLHLMMVSFYRPEGRRRKIIVEHGLFPSDRYAINSQLRWHGLDPEKNLIVLKPEQGELLGKSQILDSIDKHGDETALVMLGGVNYLSGQYFDLATITNKAHEKGCLVGFDLAHAFANVPLKLHDWGPDFAVWCSYKYFNGGPGSLSGCFIHEKHHSVSLPRFEGWWGQDLSSRFLMPDDFDPAPGAEAWQVSNLPILSMAPLRASAELFSEVGMNALRQKSKLLTGFAEFQIERRLAERAEIISPSDPEQRGAQLSVRLKEASKATIDELEEQGFLLDWREPDVLRIAPVPMYNSFDQVDKLIKAISLFD